MNVRFAAVLIGFCLLTVAPAQAETAPVLSHMATKLIRGVVNFATGWAEVPKQIYLIGREEGWTTGMIRGPIDGLGMFAARTVAGAYEILTFPLPIPPGYQPMLQPDYVWQAEPPEAQAFHAELPPALEPSRMSAKERSPT